jgi:hypothetical protein
MGFARIKTPVGDIVEDKAERSRGGDKKFQHGNLPIKRGKGKLGAEETGKENERPVCRKTYQPQDCMSTGTPGKRGDGTLHFFRISVGKFLNVWRKGAANIP